RCLNKQQGRLNTWLTFTSALPTKVAQFPVGANTQALGHPLLREMTGVATLGDGPTHGNSQSFFLLRHTPSISNWNGWVSPFEEEGPLKLDINPKGCL
ncbi:hypothetical protein, partial [Variovorax paradoxus]|uniref:hypothetical protein n=1 Tax=Variovorax paradoxus TaxID=34073 RepID=UPI00399531BC